VQLILELPVVRARIANSKMQEKIVENERPLAHDEKVPLCSFVSFVVNAAKPKPS
jgi:hypothetical protein